MWSLRGAVQPYGWGSTTLLPEFLGIVPDGTPLAELWFGAHAAAPTLAVPTAPYLAEPVGRDRAGSLADLVALHPGKVLGARVRRRFGDRMPYLVKLLAIDRALSLQVHPDAEQAAAGWLRETEAGLETTLRSYTDDQHKPETLVALRPTTALAGFRAPDDVARTVAALGLDDLALVVAMLRAAGPPAERIREAFGRTLGLPPETVRRALAALAAHRGDVEPWGHDHLAIGRELLCDHPNDVGALAALFLNPVRLEPGESLNVGAGTVHCYVRGFGLEIMASSDNVLRAGLTTKRVDVDELFRLLDTEPTSADVRAATGSWPATGVWLQHYDLPFAEYGLDVVALTAGPARYPSPVADGPRIVVGLAGVLVATTPTGRSVLGPGDAALVAHDEALTFSGTGQAALIGVPGGSVRGARYSRRP